MKVLFLSRLYLPHIGGVELHIQKLVPQLGPEFDVTVVTEQHDPSLPLTEKIGEVNVLRIPLPNQQTSKLKIWWWWLRHLKLIFTADVIHIHDVFFWLLPFKFIFFWKKLYITFHGYEGINNPKWNQKLWHQVADVLTEGNICIGGFHQKWFGVQPSVISFGAVEKNKNMKSELSSSALIHAAKKPIQLIYVGRLASDSGILVYLETVHILQAHYQLTLDVYGDGPERQLAEEVVAKYKLPVTFHGFVESEKIEWKKFDVAFVSRYLAILEAFMAGLPVIAQYNVAIKKDYLCLTPFKNWIQVGQTTNDLVLGFEKVFLPESDLAIKEAQLWAKAQTWQKLAQDYKDLWQKN